MHRFIVVLVDAKFESNKVPLTLHVVCFEVVVGDWIFLSFYEHYIYRMLRIRISRLFRRFVWVG